MNPVQHERDLGHSAKVLKNPAYDFSAKYMAAGGLQRAIQDAPQTVGPDIISVLKQVLLDKRISRETQSFFLFKKIAEILCSAMTHAKGSPAGKATHAVLADLLGITTGSSRMALAETVGGLSLELKGPHIGKKTPVNGATVRWEDLIAETGMVNQEPPLFLGRSVVVRARGTGELLVLKFARPDEPLESLVNEALWTRLLRAQEGAFSLRFDIPEPLTPGGSPRGNTVFRLKDLPWMPLPGQEKGAHAIGYRAHPEYFAYPNVWKEGGGQSRARFREVMFRNAHLFGQLTSMGMIHRAPVPLFHNRVQGLRRQDRGLYEWHRGGRLDRWLQSCAYPNFGPTGIRDFEHMISLRGPAADLYQDIGSQLLGLFLVVGSYFRNKDPRRVGLDRNGSPVDARDLFERDLFQDLIQGIFLHYHRGFAGKSTPGEVPFDWETLAARMIEEMGVDRHMEEVLRVVDQDGMDEKTFRHFLRRRGYSEEEVLKSRKGDKDITLLTGPHLGGFNQGISLPELTETLASMSALCVLARYMKTADQER